MLFSGTVAFSWSAGQRLDVIGASRMPWFVDNSVRSYACSTTLPIFLGVDIKTRQLQRHFVRVSRRSAMEVQFGASRKQFGTLCMPLRFALRRAALGVYENQHGNVAGRRVSSSA